MYLKTNFHIHIIPVFGTYLGCLRIEVGVKTKKETEGTHHTKTN